jgi:signal transduction histidine kinase
LARLTVQGRHELERGLVQAASASASAIHVARVGVWFLSPDGTSLLCACQCGPEGRADPSDAVLSLDATPRYREALMSRRVVLVDDALTAPETRELAQRYLLPNSITSMLDAPIYRFGEVVGVVCHEHIGPQRTWTPRERDFAASVADIIAVLLEQATRMDSEAQLLAQREHAAKLERQASLSRFAAGVAHDFNNVLMAMVLQLNLLREETAEPIRSGIEEVLEFANTGRGIVAQLLTYCKAGPKEPRTVVLSKVLRERRRLLQATLGHSHELKLDISEGDGPIAVHVDPAQLDQVLLNLVTNARDAMPGGGTVTISLRLGDDSAILTVADEGVGIEEGARDRIFEPFFTTKGAGTGLGLSTVFSVIQQHNGVVDVESEPGRGTRFVVRLPCVGV